MIPKNQAVYMPYGLIKVRILIQIHPVFASWRNNNNFKLLWEKFEHTIDQYYNFDRYGIRVVPLNKINQWIDEIFYQSQYLVVREVLKQRFAKLVRA